MTCRISLHIRYMLLLFIPIRWVTLDQRIKVYPYKPSVLFVGHRQTVQNPDQTPHFAATDQGFHCLLTEYTIKGMFYQKELYEPWILIQVSSKLVEKWGSNGHLKNSIRPTFSLFSEYLISFQKFFKLSILSQHLCVSRYAALYLRKRFYLR